MKRPNKETPAREVGSRIRKVREDLGLSQAIVAERARMDIADLSKLENGRSGSRGPTLARIYQVAQALGVPPAQLLT